MQYYGQFETDRLIEKLFPENYIGNCIEVGAYDGIKGSNTKFFEDKGWKCLCIEPIPEKYRKCCKNRKECVGVACDCYSGVAAFSIFDIGDNHILSSLSSLDTDPRLINDYKNITNSVREVYVPVDRLANIIRGRYWPKTIDFVSIDTEGTELNVLKGIDFTYVKIKYLIIENNYNDSDIEEYLLNFNYKKINRYKVNDFYELQN